MTRYSYGITRYQPARKGVLSLYCFIGAAVMLFGCIGIAWVFEGDGSVLLGLVAVLACALSAYGLWKGIQSFHEPDRSYTISKIAVVLNGLLLAGFATIYSVGVR